MSTATKLPFKGPVTLYTWSVEKYERMLAAGLLADGRRIELLEGHMLLESPATAAHDAAVLVVSTALGGLIPTGWTTRCRAEMTLSGSRPKPDVVVARPADLGLVVEVSDSSLDRDQQDKTRIYARDRVPVYWVVNLVDRRVEVYTDPTGPGDDPRYLTTRVFDVGAAVPVELDGATVGTMLVADLMP